MRSLLLCGLALAGVAPCARASGVHAALSPALAQVAPDTEFDLRIVVTQAGPAFDSYHAMVVYDPGVLTFVQRPASVQEGSAMVSACGSTFHHFTASTFELDISHALVCSGQTLTGPGELYVLRFRAAAQPQATDVFFAQIAFASAGDPVAVATAGSAAIQIGAPTDAIGTGRNDPRLRLSPNPAPAGAVVQLEAFGTTPDHVAIFDARGRAVHRGAWGASSRYVWTPRGALGARLPAGVYWVQVESRDRSMTRRVTLLD